MSEPHFRRATLEDIPDIVAMLADDDLGATRETPDNLAPYIRAFEGIDADPNQLLIVAELEGNIAGTLQLSFIHGLSRMGSTRMLIEAVRIHRDARGSGLGTTMILWALQQARERGCTMAQLTTDATRKDAHRFYEQLGFQPTHVGMKLKL